MNKTVPYNTIEYIQKDKELLSVILKNAVAYSLIEDIMRSSNSPHAKLTSIHEVIHEN